MSPAGQAAWLADEELRPAREKKAAEEAAAAGEQPKVKKSVGERLKAAANSIGGGSKSKGDGGPKTKASKPARGKSQTSTPRKAGGA